MFTEIEKLGIMEGSISSLKREIFSVYSYEEEELQELLCRFFQKINECVNISNKTLEIMKWVETEGLPKEVIKVLEKWLSDGTFKNIINEELFEELNNLIKSKTRIEVTDIAPSIPKQNVVYFVTGEGMNGVVPTQGLQMKLVKNCGGESCE